MPRHLTAGSRVGAVASAPRWAPGPPWAPQSKRRSCLKCRPRRGAILAPGLALAAHSGLWVRCDVGLRRFSEDVATAARPSSAALALAHAALAGGSDKALPVSGAMGFAAHVSLAWLKEAWPTKEARPTKIGLNDSPDYAAEWAGRTPDVKAWRMAAPQRATSHEDADARAPAILSQQNQVAGDSMAQSTAWSGGAHGSRLMHR